MAAIALDLERARSGQGQALVGTGEAGLGKTRVLAQAQKEARGFAVGVGGGQAMEATLHFGIVSEALRGVGAGTPLDVQKGAGSAGLDARAAYFYATLRHPEGRAGPAPLLLPRPHSAAPASLPPLSFLTPRPATLAGAGAG